MSSLEFQNKVFIVTGAGGGVGRATCLLLHSLGARLCVTDNRQRALLETAQLCDKEFKVHKIIADLTDSSQNENIVTETMTIFGRIDCLVNIAAIGGNVALNDDRFFELYDKFMNINVKSVLELCRSCIPHLKASKGNLVNMSTLLSDRPVQDCILYCMSKAALDNMTRCLALELAPFGIRVNSVNAGVIDTDFVHNSGFCTLEENKMFVETLHSQHLLGRNCKSHEIAQAIAFLSSSEKASFCTGTFLNVGGGWNLTPPSASKK